jgi:uncharacterized Zn-binding protein involved in type VI secretion
MEMIRGWIRLQDKATCGGTVAACSPYDLSDGIGYAFQGARMSCGGSCTISDGYSSSLLSNGKAQVLDGQRTSAGCTLISTLNGVDGVADDT